MTNLLIISVYAALAVFLVAVVVRILRYRLTPVHMRWELYPVAHEKGRHHYGGSRFEELDWWTRDPGKDRFNEISEMFQEIFLLKGVWRNNRGLWWLSFPLHLGLYACILWLVTLVVGGSLEIAGVSLEPAYESTLTWTLAVSGYGGFSITTLGALGLLARRAGRADLRRYSGVFEYLNLAIIALVAGTALVVQATHDPLFADTRGFVSSLMAFRTPEELGIAQSVEMGLGAFLVAYIPLTRMSHFVAKYFLYHDVRWHDEPNTRGSKIEARVKQALDFGVSWDAKHIQKGKKWAEVVTEVDS